MQHTTHTTSKLGQLWFRAELIGWVDGLPFGLKMTEVRTQKQAHDWARQQLATHPGDEVRLRAGQYIWLQHVFLDVLEARYEASAYRRGDGRMVCRWRSL